MELALGTLAMGKTTGIMRTDGEIFSQKLRCCVAVIPVYFGNMGGDCETCRVGARCMERLPNPVPSQR